jgi:preprotein translocase subunit SecD
MKIRRVGFNFYLAGLLALGLAAGCQSEKSRQKKVLAALRLHQEIHNDPTGHTETVVVHRDPEVKMKIDKEAFLTGMAVQEAKVMDVLGGFALRLQFDRQGTWLLEQYTAATRGRHIAIFTQFVNPGEKKLNKGRWLAAPLISNIITNGQLTFTPDATKPEAEQIARGLNNVARMLETGKEPKF